MEAFDTALVQATAPDVTAIGFVFTKSDLYVGVDLDDCRDPDTGSHTDEAVDIIIRHHLYTEISIGNGCPCHRSGSTSRRSAAARISRDVRSAAIFHDDWQPLVCHTGGCL